MTGSMELDIIPAELCFVLCFEAGCSSICSLPSYSPGEPSLARAYYLKLRETGFGTLWGRKKKFEIRHISLMGSAPCTVALHPPVVMIL